MTESEWLVSTDPRAMLDAIRDRTLSGRQRLLDRTSDRKLRQWVEACRDVCNCLEREQLYSTADAAAAYQDVAGCPSTKEYRAALLRDIFSNPWHRYYWNPWSNGKGKSLRRDRPHVDEFVMDSDTLAWNDGTVPKIAQAIYGEAGPCDVCGGIGSWEVSIMAGNRIPCQNCDGTGWHQGTFDASLMPILADALEEAGCTDEAILRHCRGEERCRWCLEPLQAWACFGQSGCQGRRWLPINNPHVRGCWVLDLLLGKE
jgi:hypothetical protein